MAMRLVLQKDKRLALVRLEDHFPRSSTWASFYKISPLYSKNNDDNKFSRSLRLGKDTGKGPSFSSKKEKPE